jgi:hypothetical protein
MSVVDDVSRLIAFLRDPSSGARLSQEEYGRDFADRLWLADTRDTWKLERMQFYDETGFPGWDAFAAGDWDRSMELYDEMRPELEAFFGRYRERGSRFCRIRVVETPLTPYLHWELHCLRIRAQCGATLYATEYDDAAKPGGARRFTDRQVIAAYEGLAGELFSSGEDLESYFHRELAPLPPPRP